MRLLIQTTEANLCCTLDKFNKSMPSFGKAAQKVYVTTMNGRKAVFLAAKEGGSSS
jgi:hypothetical protein